MDYVTVLNDTCNRAPLEIPLPEGPRVACDNRDRSTPFLERDFDHRLSLSVYAAFIHAWRWYIFLWAIQGACMPEMGQHKRHKNRTLVKSISGYRYILLAKFIDFAQIHKGGLRPTSMPETDTVRPVESIPISGSFVSQMPHTLSLGNPGSPGRYPVDELFGVLLSAQSICQTLMGAMLGGATIHHLKRDRCSRVDTLLVDKLLHESGWQQVEVQRLPRNVIFRYYLSHIRESHHAGRRAILRKTVPQRKKSDFHDATSFVAITHVRSTGLGNDAKNALPRCRLHHIQSLVNQILPPEPEKKGTNTPFWIDTLCVPLRSKHRRTEMSQIWKAFRLAGAVLVLDPTLSKHVYSTPEEALVRIRFSLWKRRLWTLEEGYYATRLAFSFRDRLVWLDQLLTEIRHSFLVLTGLRQHGVPDAIHEMMDRPDLTQALDAFAADVRSTSELVSAADREQLYSVLRVCYLSSPKFLYLLERHEVECIQVVLPSLLRIYRHTTDHQEDNRFARLRAMCDEVGAFVVANLTGADVRD
ncbi:het domain protein [Apiospora rasikravindrae]|uniref:Het domain protein n=1 Tax=Apiospora rasikravindrae TaxID=990691 RepID=A0ABR1SY25_9PEZI